MAGTAQCDSSAGVNEGLSAQKFAVSSRDKSVIKCGACNH